jgi:hypothetical protein
MSAGQDAHVIELCAEVGDGMKGVRRRIVGVAARACGAVLEPVVDALSPIASFVSTLSG